MKFSLTQDALLTSVVVLGSLAVGVVASDAIVNIVPADQKQIAKVGIAGGGLMGAAGLQKDKSTTGTALKSMALGASVKQGVNLMREVFAKDYTPKENPGIADRAFEGAMGLACPSDNNMALSGETFNAVPTFNFPVANETVDTDAVVISTNAL